MDKTATTFKNKLAAATAARQVTKRTGVTYDVRRAKTDAGKSRWVLVKVNVDA